LNRNVKTKDYHRRELNGRQRKYNPEVLKAKAKELLNKAKKIEERRFKEVGQLVYEHYTKDYADFDIEQFKSQVKEVFEGKRKREIYRDLVEIKASYEGKKELKGKIINDTHL
jgi:valyl-tRNA synthetase